MADYYPNGLHPAKSASVINICPDEEGKLTKPVEVVESSGDRALDEAAVRWATDARFRPRKNPVTGAPHVSCEFLAR
jgi:TonB family protein